MEPNKGGRPVKIGDVGGKRIVMFRVSEQLGKALDRAAEARKMTLSELLRVEAQRFTRFL